MRLRDLITDDKYKDEEKKLEMEIKKLEDNLNKSNEEEIEIRAKADKAFDFITYAHYWFLNGNLEKKRIIASALGSNFLLKGRELTIEPSLWFIPVKDGYPKIEAKYIRFELDKTPESDRTDEQKAAFEEIKNEWSCLVKDVRTKIREHQGPIYIPKLALAA